MSIWKILLLVLLKEEKRCIQNWKEKKGFKNGGTLAINMCWMDLKFLNKGSY